MSRKIGSSKLPRRSSRATQTPRETCPSFPAGGKLMISGKSWATWSGNTSRVWCSVTSRYISSAERVGTRSSQNSTPQFWNLLTIQSNSSMFCLAEKLLNTFARYTKTNYWGVFQNQDVVKEKVEQKLLAISQKSLYKLNKAYKELVLIICVALSNSPSS